MHDIILAPIRNAQVPTRILTTLNAINWDNLRRLHAHHLRAQFAKRIDEIPECRILQIL